MEAEDKLIELLRVIGVNATYNIYEKDFCGIYLENLEIFTLEEDTIKIEGLLSVKTAKGDCGIKINDIVKKVSSIGMLITTGGIRIRIMEDGTKLKSFNFDVIITKEIVKIKEVHNGNNS